MRPRNVCLYLLGCAAVFALIPACVYLAEASAMAQVVADGVPVAVTPVPVPVAPTLPWEAWLALGLAALGGIGMMIRGAEIVVGIVAKRTKTTVDDAIHVRLDQVADALEELLSRFGRGPAPTPEPPPRDPQAGRAKLGLVALIATVGLSAIASAGTGCAPTTREATIKTALVTVDSARAAFIQYSKVKHDQIARSVPTRAEGERQLDALEGKEDVVLKAFVGAYAAIGVAATLQEDQGREAIRSAIEQVIAAFNAMTRGAP